MRCQEAVHPHHLLSCWDLTGSWLSLQLARTVVTGVALAGTWDQIDSVRGEWQEHYSGPSPLTATRSEQVSSRGLGWTLSELGRWHLWWKVSVTGYLTPGGSWGPSLCQPAPRSATCRCNPSPSGYFWELTQGAAGECVCVYACVPEYPCHLSAHCIHVPVCYVWTCACVFMQVFLCACTWDSCVHVYVHMPMPMCVGMWKYVDAQCLCVSVYLCVNACVCMYVCPYACACVCSVQFSW